MHLLVINSSPYGRRGITAMMLMPFLEGIREAGGTSEIVSLNKLTIHPCRGCYTCWFKTKNVCTQKDDMAEVIARFRKADCIVFSTPVYCDGVPGQLKVMMDRLIATGNPLLEIRDSRTRHPAPPDYTPKRFVLISSCGLWEMENFIPITTHLRAFCDNIGYEYSGALLRPHSFAMRNSPVNDILRAAKSAGYELAKNGGFPRTAADIVGREIVSRDAYINMINKKGEMYTML